MSNKKINKFWSIGKTWQAIYFLVAVIVFFLWFSCSGLGSDFKNWIESSNAAASWVQAIGSIIAIFIAILISHIDRRAAAGIKLKDDNNNYIMNKKVVIASINRLGGSINASLIRFTLESNRSKWDIKMMRVLLEDECERANSAPFVYLNSEEQRAFFAIYLLGIQLVEAMLEAENREFIAENGEVLVAEEGYSLLLRILNNTRGKFEESISILKNNLKNDTIYSGGYID